MEKKYMNVQRFILAIAVIAARVQEVAEGNYEDNSGVNRFLCS